MTGKETIAEVKPTEIFEKIKYSWTGVSYFTTAHDPCVKFIRFSERCKSSSAVSLSSLMFSRLFSNMACGFS